MSSGCYPGGLSSGPNFVCIIVRSPLLIRFGRAHMPWRWEEQAQNWIRWVAAGDDSYRDYADAFFELLPSPHGITLELGCGEGRVVRDLAARGYAAFGLELSETLVGHAAGADPGGTYVRADARRLPFAAESIDLVVAFNSLMDIQDMPMAVQEVARVLRREGRFCFSVTHPIADAGAFASRTAEAPFVIEGSYLDERDYEQTFQRSGRSMTFSGWVYPLQSYFLALEAAGFLVERLREPPAPERAVERDPPEHRWQRVPAFLHISAVLGGSEV
jgi:SAM-dependent methyltransferase